MQQTQTTTPAFDAVKYKQTTLQQWNNAGETWHRGGHCCRTLHVDRRAQSPIEFKP